MMKGKKGIACLLAFAMIIMHAGTINVAVAEENQEETIQETVVLADVVEAVTDVEVVLVEPEEILELNEVEEVVVDTMPPSLDYGIADDDLTDDEAQEDTLANGIYSIPAKILQAMNNTESMANDAIESAVITVNGDDMTLSLNMQSLMGVYLQSMTYQNEANNTVNLSVTKVENGNNVQFSMPIVEGMEEVFVGFSFEIAPGVPMTQAARLILDWTELTFLAELDENTNVGGDENQGGNAGQGGNVDQDSNANQGDNTQDGNTNQGGSSNTGNVSLDKNNLPDGVYEVQVALWNSTQNQASMASGSVVKLARIAVRNGVSTMYLYTQPMTLGNITASLQYLQVENGSGGYAQAAVNTRSSAGDPTSFSFRLPHTNDYIAVRVNPEVAIMGNTYIDARLRVDWNSLKAVSGDTNLASPPNTSGVAGIGGVGASSGPVNTSDQNNSVFILLFIASAIIIAEYGKRKNLLERNYL